MKNPFEWLGISESLIKRTNPEELAIIVNSVWKGLQLCYHPDRTGKKSTTKIVEINRVYDEIDPQKNYDSFLKYREEALKKASETKIDKIAILEKTIGFEKEKRETLESLLVKLIQPVSSPKTYLSVSKSIDIHNANINKSGPFWLVEIPSINCMVENSFIFEYDMFNDSFSKTSRKALGSIKHDIIGKWFLNSGAYDLSQLNNSSASCSSLQALSRKNPIFSEVSAEDFSKNFILGFTPEIVQNNWLVSRDSASTKPFTLEGNITKDYFGNAKEQKLIARYSFIKKNLHTHFDAKQNKNEINTIFNLVKKASKKYNLSTIIKAGDFLDEIDSAVNEKGNEYRYLKSSRIRAKLSEIYIKTKPALDGKIAALQYLAG